jgi:hypothetical protein
MNIFKTQLHRFKYALRPVFESAGLAWQAPPAPASMKTGMAAAVALGLLMLRAIVGSTVTRC